MLVIYEIYQCVQLVGIGTVVPPSDKLGGEICIALARACMLVTIWCMYSLTTNTMPTRIVCAHSHLLLTLRRGNQISIETESE